MSNFTPYYSYVRKVDMENDPTFLLNLLPFLLRGGGGLKR